MTAFSDYLENGLQEHFKLDTQLPLEDTYVALHTADPLDDGSGAEVTGGSYARVQVNQDGTTPPFWEDSDTGLGIQNQSAVTFPTATASWGTITHVAVWDAATTGNLLFHGALSASKVVGSGDTFEFAAGELDIRFD